MTTDLSPAPGPGTPAAAPASPKKTVCVDLDGVLARYEGWKGEDHFGEPLPGAVEFTRRLAEYARVVVFTTRCKADLGGRPAGATPEDLAATVRAWLDRHGFACDEVYTGQGKPIAAAYVDDRAVACVPQEMHLDEFAWALYRCRELCGAH